MDDIVKYNSKREVISHESGHAERCLSLEILKWHCTVHSNNYDNMSKTNWLLDVLHTDFQNKGNAHVAQEELIIVDLTPPFAETQCTM